MIPLQSRSNKLKLIRTNKTNNLKTIEDMHNPTIGNCNYLYTSVSDLVINHYFLLNQVMHYSLLVGKTRISLLLFKD